MFRFGIEHEVALLRADGRFVDWTTTSFEELDAIVRQLPRYESDYPMLRIGDLGIKEKRWYIEGYERYDDCGRYLETVPKGIEIRTTIGSSIGATIDELSQSFAALRDRAVAAGFEPVWIALNPVQERFVPNPPLRPWEEARRASSPEKRTAEIPMLTYGPDLNLSIDGMSPEASIDAAMKLTYYSPYLIPFSFSSPFFGGERWRGYSKRTELRTGIRPAALVFLADRSKLIASSPSLTKPARLPAEDGRIEFKAFDSLADFALYGSLLALLKGLLLDDTLAGRALVPDRALHQRAARYGFDDDDIFFGALAVLTAAERALAFDPDQPRLNRLFALIEQRRTPAHWLIDLFERAGALEPVLRGSYQRFGALVEPPV
ncbi:MAG: glutamate-cysteine ligase family protein [Chloroflexota bacterium]|nr:glutamate-cysteine ligase family protein [Dehalococcoidia bacterium]MDW8254122.1 glutamate-cysteine ligase family protein [Chloroflexota bacterium]